jgi:hypothetical protein
MTTTHSTAVPFARLNSNQTLYIFSSARSYQVDHQVELINKDLRVVINLVQNNKYQMN